MLKTERPVVRPRYIFAFLIANMTFACFVEFVAAPTVIPSAIRATAKTMLLRPSSSNDSWVPMGYALDHLHSNSEQPVYSELLIRNGVKFQYPLTSLLPYAAMKKLSFSTGIDLYLIASFINGLFIAGLIACCAALMGKLWQMSQLASIGMAAFAMLTFYPVTRGFALGQIQIWIDALVAAALLSWTLSRKKTAGVLMGLAALIKPHYAVVLLWGAVRREWGFAATCSATGVVGLATATLIFGVDNTLDFLNALSFLSSTGESFYANNSVNGILNRWVGLGNADLFNNLEWRGNAFPPYSSIVFYGTLLSSVVLIFAALLTGR